MNPPDLKKANITDIGRVDAKYCEVHAQHAYEEGCDPIILLHVRSPTLSASPQSLCLGEREMRQNIALMTKSMLVLKNHTRKLMKDSVDRNRVEVKALIVSLKRGYKGKSGEVGMVLSRGDSGDHRFSAFLDRESYYLAVEAHLNDHHITVSGVYDDSAETMSHAEVLEVHRGVMF